MKLHFSPWMVVFPAAGLYLLSLSRHYTADGLLYALAIEGNDPSQLLDPTHLALHPLGWVWYQGWVLAGWQGGSLLPLQLLNAAAGALSAGLLAAIANRITGSRAIATLCGLGFTVSGGLWLLSVEAEFVTVPMASMLVVLWLLVVSPVRDGGIGYPVRLSLATSLAVATYLTSLFLVAVVGMGLWMQRYISTRDRRRTIGIFLGVLFAILVPAGFVVMIIWTGGDWSRVVELAGGGRYGQLSLLNLPRGVYALLRSLALYRGLAMNDSTEAFLARAGAAERILFAGFYLVVLILSLLPVIGALRHRSRLRSEYRRVLGILAVWIILFGAFAVIWVPGDISFWLPLLAAWWLLSGLVLSCLDRPSFRHWSLVSGATIGLLLVLNGVLLIWPRHDLASNNFYHLAKRVETQSTVDDLIITTSDDALALYVAYFAGRHVIALPAHSTPDSEVGTWIMSQPWVDEACKERGKVLYIHDQDIKEIGDCG